MWWTTRNKASLKYQRYFHVNLFKFILIPFHVNICLSINTFLNLEGRYFEISWLQKKISFEKIFKTFFKWMFYLSTYIWHHNFCNNTNSFIEKTCIDTWLLILTQKNTGSLYSNIRQFSFEIEENPSKPYKINFTNMPNSS